jgi:hypothetical protein
VRNNADPEARYAWFTARLAYYFLIIDVLLCRPIIAELLSGVRNVNVTSSSVKKTLVPVVGALAVLWVLGCGLIYSSMRRPPEQFGRVMSKLPGELPFMIFPFETMWMRARGGALQIGDSAPDFTLTKLDKSERVQLSSLTTQGKPVALIFGSYT